ncbi:hypothetical protein [Streptomyces sp. NPDC012746]|uniref:hypothetical protein n=1 Tax=Streptomyces sp. NPDC012746 TaxID=3364845 RepID=UPI0036B9E97B
MDGGGTALHCALNLELFQPWPALSHLVDEYPMVIAIASYLTVLLQVAFPFVLFGRLKYPVLTVLLGMHIGIAVLLGLPLFSGAMIIADAVFLPDRFYAFLPRLWRHAARRTGVWRPSGGIRIGTSAGQAQRTQPEASSHSGRAAGHCACVLDLGDSETRLRALIGYPRPRGLPLSGGHADTGSA